MSGSREAWIVRRTGPRTGRVDREATGISENYGGTGTTGRESIDARLAAAGLPPLLRSTWLEIDTGVLAANGRWLRRLTPDGTALGIVVKADGYGHGLEAAARAAIEGGADLLVVATLDEALALRGAGIDGRILLLYPVPAPVVETALEARLDLVATDDASVGALVDAMSRRSGRRRSPGAEDVLVHLGIDTGMSRGGLAPERAVEAARRLLGAGLGRLAGTWSHLASPEDPGSVAAQVERFETALAALDAAGIDPGLRHLDATGGLVGGGAPTYDLVRIGLAFYGVLPPEVAVPSELAAVTDRLLPALTLRARASTITAIRAGARVGYGGTWTATRPTIVATVALGYADGWTRAYAAGSWGMVRGRRAPLIGRVSSDAIALDVTDVPGFSAADEIVLLGREAPAMRVHDLAALRGSIAWEVLDSLGPRIARVYVNGPRLVGVRYLDGHRPVAGG